MKKTHIFTDEYLERCKKLSIEERLDYLENYRLTHTDKDSSLQRLSLNISKPLLDCFKQKAKLEGIAYQTQIKKLMKDWVN